MRVWAARALGQVADWVYPRCCPGCGKVSGRTDGRHLCWACRARVELYTESLCEVCGRFAEGHVGHRFVCGACRELTPAFDRARAAGRFRGMLRDQLHLFKYARALWLRQDLVDFLEGCLASHFDVGEVDVVMPVPLHAARQRERTYNQAAVLAKELAGRIGRRYDGGVLVRTHPTASQTRLRAAQRRANMRQAFGVRDEAWVRRRCVLLVDDVMTTGATLDACARVLKKSGARAVWAVTVGRGV